MTVAGATVPARMSQQRRRPAGLLLVLFPVGLLGWLILYPILNALVTTLTLRTEQGRVLSLDSYVTFFSDPYSLNNLALTFWTTAVCAVLLLVICLPIALYLRFSRGALSAYVQALAIFPLFVPSVILAYALIRTLGPNGLVDILLNTAGLPKLPSPYLTPWGPVIGLVWDNIPLTVLMLTAGLGQVSDNAVEAARDAGARPRHLLLHIILPQIINALLVALAFAVLGIFSSFTLPYVLGPASPEMMGPYMQRTFADLMQPRMAITQAVITFAICAVFGAFYVRSVIRSREVR